MNSSKLRDNANTMSETFTYAARQISMHDINIITDNDKNTEKDFYSMEILLMMNKHTHNCYNSMKKNDIVCSRIIHNHPRMDLI